MGDLALAEALRDRGIHDARVLEAIATLDRRDFIPADQAGEAQGDYPLPIGFGQTISQPFIVAYMTQELQLRPASRVLEIGTGSGYQTAVLSLLCAQVYSIEIIPELARRAATVLERLGFDNVALRCADGGGGWPQAAPFDAILLTAAPASLPPALVEQLGPGGRLIAPVGEEHGDQRLVRVVRRLDGAVEVEPLLAVRFVPLTSELLPA